MTSQLKFLEKQIWNGFLHSGEDIIPYLSKDVFGDTDCVFVLWDGVVLTKKKINEFMEKAYGIRTLKWLTYDMADEEVIEVDMMAGVIYYGVLASRMENGKLVQYKLACSSVWRQNADGEYTISSHQETRLP